jgi:hypothetical protein
MPEGACIWSREGFSVCSFFCHWDNKIKKILPKNPSWRGSPLAAGGVRRRLHLFAPFEDSRERVFFANSKERVLAEFGSSGFWAGHAA